MPETVLFQRYRLIEPAGRGGSAEVWRAVDERTGETVAVKRLHPVVFADPAGRQRLEREFDTLRALDEPHIVRVRDLHFGDREAILVLDYVRGESLAGRLERLAAAGTPMSPSAAVEVVEDIAAALSAAHAAGIVHRDVTPGNILLSEAGAALLTDFGIAHAEGVANDVTATGLMMGTLRYLAPEQLRGGTSTPASDLHGLATIAYEMLAGHPAYAATSPVSLAEEQTVGPPPLVGVPAALDAAIRSGLAVDPARRPTDVRTFAAGLSAALSDALTVATRIADRDQTAAFPVPVVDRGGASMAGRAVPGVAVAAAGSARSTGSRTPRRTGLAVPAPVALVLGLVVAVGLVVAATSLDARVPAGAGTSTHSPSDARIAPAVVTVSTSPSPSPTASVTPSVTPPVPSRGHGHGHGHRGD